jgi:predicted sulfurtransferase
MACLAAVLLAAATAQSAPRPGSGQADAIDAPRITQQAFKKLVAANNVLVIDTRNLDAFNVSHMRGALPLPLEGRLTWPDEYEKTVALALKSKKPVVTYCA